MQDNEIKDVAELKAIVARNIKKLRIASGLLGEEYAEKIGVPRIQLSRLEKGASDSIRFETILRLGNQISLDRFFKTEFKFNIG